MMRQMMAALSVAAASMALACTFLFPLDGYGPASSSDAGADGDAGADSAIAFVQATTNFSLNNSVSSLDAMLPQPLAAGDTLVVFTAWGNATGAMQSLTDTVGNTFALAGAIARSDSTSQPLSQAVYYATNTKASAGADVVSITFTMAVNAMDLRIVEYAGLSSTAPFTGQIASKFASDGNAFASLSVVGTGPLLVVAGGTGYVGYTAAGPSFNSRLLNNDQGILVDLITQAPGTFTASPTLAGATSWLVTIAAFQ